MISSGSAYPFSVSNSTRLDVVQALRASRAAGDPLGRALRSIYLSESPIEAKFAVWFSAGRDHLLSEGFDRFALNAAPQRWVRVNDANYRLDFALEPMDSWLRDALAAHGLDLKIGVELDGHDYHERTKEQVTARNQRDRDFSSAKWQILHFSGSELHHNPMIAVVEVLTVGADALDQAKAAFFHR